MSDTAYRAFNVYSYITLLLFVFLGSVSIHSSNNIANKSVSVGPTVQQIIPDWQQTPFVSITVNAAASGCPTGSQPILTRKWQGMYASCDCLSAFDPYSEESANYNFNSYVACNDTQIQNGCSDVKAWPEMYQSILNGASSSQVMVCGKTGGTPFQNVTRPNVDGVCPNSYEACSTVTSAENTVCYPSNVISTSCPITDIQIVDNLNLSDLDASYSSVAFNDTASIAYSKKTDNLPLTSFSIQVQPCINPYD